MIRSRMLDGGNLLEIIRECGIGKQVLIQAVLIIFNINLIVIVHNFSNYNSSTSNNNKIHNLQELQKSTIQQLLQLNID